ncbi:MAG: hypothetical protein AAFX87_24070 [Bacteroidota bacterium]
MISKSIKTNTLKTPLYCIVGLRPVKAFDTEDGGLDIHAFNWETKAFERHMEYLSVIYFGTQYDVEEVTKEEFDRYVEELRSKK